MIGDAVAQSSAEPAKDGTPPDFSLSANVSLASQYRVRGLMQTNSEPAIQGGLDLSHSSGFYVGNWNSSITWLSSSAPVEMDFYGGYTKKIMGDLSVDVGAIRYYYPGSYVGSPNTTELYLGLGYGSFSFKYS
ncbi:MAG: TorF family putative porin, partial [Burkholderiaceae bacterium]